MSSIRRTKKVIKKSNGFLSIKVGEMIFPINEWDDIKFHKKEISINMTTYIPYKLMDAIF